LHAKNQLIISTCTDQLLLSEFLKTWSVTALTTYMNKETVPVIDSKKNIDLTLFKLFMAWISCIIIIKRKWGLNPLWTVLHSYNTLIGTYYGQDCIKMLCRKLSCILFVGLATILAKDL